MLKKWMTNQVVKKAIVYLAVFTVTGSLISMMGLQRANTVEAALLKEAVKVNPLQLTVSDAAGFIYEGGILNASITPMFNEADSDVPGQTRSLNEFYESRSRSRDGDEVDTDRPKVQVEVREQTEGFVYLESLPISRELQEYTYEQCQAKNLEYELVLALMWRESRFNVDAVNTNSNGTRDSGIMQINDINRTWLEELGITDLMDPEQNIDAGTTILSRLMSKYETQQALLAYQYGEVGMQRKLNEGVTTTRSIQALYEKRDQYKSALENAE